MGGYVKKEKPSFTQEDLRSKALLCNSKSEFYEKYKSEYRFAVKNGIIKEILLLIPRKKKWTKESLLLESKKYSSRIEWMNKDMSSYNTSLKSGFHDECVSHMGEKKEFGPEVKWSFEVVKEIYSKYTILKTLIENEKGAYTAALREGWHKELSKDMVRNRHQKNIKWTYEKIKEEALKYNSIIDMSRNSTSAYHIALKNKWLDSIIGHMTGGNTKWTLPKLVEVLSQYPKNEWSRKCAAAHKYIKRHNLEEKVMEQIYGNKNV